MAKKCFICKGEGFYRNELDGIWYPCPDCERYHDFYKRKPEYEIPRPCWDYTSPKVGRWKVKP
jgi:hypothetical protein